MEEREYSLTRVADISRMEQDLNEYDEWVLSNGRLLKKKKDKVKLCTISFHECHSHFQEVVAY